MLASLYLKENGADYYLNDAQELILDWLQFQCHNSITHKKKATGEDVSWLY